MRVVPLSLFVVSGALSLIGACLIFSSARPRR